MTLKEKAKAYDEALEKAKSLSIDGYLDAVAVKEIFSDLAESEDERIRKAIKCYVEDMPDTYGFAHGIGKKEMLSYLEKLKDAFENGCQFGIMQEQARQELGWLDEKQKDSNEYVFRPLAGTDITIAAEQAIRRANEGDRLVLAFNGAYIPVRKGCNVNKIVDIYDAFIERQKEQKTPMSNDLDEEIKRFFDECIDVHEAKLYGSISERVIPVDCYELTARHFAKWSEKQKEQKPIEPSDDELQRHQDELYDFKVFAAKQAKEHHISFVHDFEWHNFCAGLLSYFNEQKPVEWSEKEFGMLFDIEHYLNGTLQLTPDRKIKCISFLKSLRPQSKKEWSKEDENKLNHILEIVHIASGSEVSVEEKEELESFLKSLRPQQKQEWSKEDEKKIHFLSRLIELQVKDDEYCFGEDFRTISKQEAIEMLKSLRPQSKQEWTEEDKNIIETLIQELRLNAQFESAVRKLGLDYVQTLTVLDKCRRLCPCSSWKPSEEQMEALKNAQDILVSDLNSLYNDLKKLM